jgi:hypothetical protein
MTSQGTITLENGDGAFRPYDEIRGTVAWELEALPKSIELRLFWFTSGRGTPEAGVVEMRSLPASLQGEERFSFSLPGSPYSLSGKLIQFTWALELVAEPLGQVGLREFILGPEKQTIELPAIDQGKTSWWKALQGNR